MCHGFLPPLRCFVSFVGCVVVIVVLWSLFVLFVLRVRRFVVRRSYSYTPGKEFTLPTATFSPGFGVSKSNNTPQAQHLSMQWPIVHMCLYVYYWSQLPTTKEYTDLLLNDRSYVTILLNCFTLIHGGENHVERKRHLIHGWDSMVSHVGSVENGVFVQRLTTDEVNAVGAIGQLGSPLPAQQGGRVVIADGYKYSNPDYAPDDFAKKYGTEVVPAKEMFHCSAQNVILCQSSTR